MGAERYLCVDGLGYDYLCGYADRPPAHWVPSWLRLLDDFVCVMNINICNRSIKHVLTYPRASPPADLDSDVVR